MQQILDFFQLTTQQFILLSLLGLFLGWAKMGLKGAPVIFIPFLAVAFGARQAAGIVAPLLIAADILAVLAYRRECNWKMLLRLIIWFLPGIILGTVVGGIIPESIFRIILGIILLLLIVLMTLFELRKGAPVLPDHLYITAPIGIVSGFSSMVGNAAGPMVSLYLLAKRIPKEYFLGTSAVFFIFVNITKIPFHVFFWKTITPESLKLNLISIPFILLGGWTGKYIVSLIPEKGFRVFIIVSSLIGVVRLLIG